MTLAGIAGASRAIGGLCGVRAVAFDFNGTIAGEPQYLAHAETAAVEPGTGLGLPGPARLGRDLARPRTVSPARPGAAVLIRRLAVHLPPAPSPRPRAEVEPVPGLAGLTHLFATMLTRTENHTRRDISRRWGASPK
ncbi:hypothetical protein ACIBKY_10615 [Nonomuraea sp. NPDC050394]|uniref:hypothetical protein n=1 Tax=Nonomuraea sp. NPDC050394 TaxID=3364363 RepID=UPI00378F9843